MRGALGLFVVTFPAGDQVSLKGIFNQWGLLAGVQYSLKGSSDTQVYAELRLVRAVNALVCELVQHIYDCVSKYLKIMTAFIPAGHGLPDPTLVCTGRDFLAEPDKK